VKLKVKGKKAVSRIAWGEGNARKLVGKGAILGEKLIVKEEAGPQPGC
jgi:hypothetical protein